MRSIYVSTLVCGLKLMASDMQFVSNRKPLKG